MRKLYLVVASCVALVAFMGLSASALAAPDPSCDLDEPGGDGPYNNDRLIRGFSIAMPDSMIAGEVSGLSGTGLACGAVTTDPNTFYDHADIGTPPGVVINDTEGMANGRFVGTALINVMTADIFGGTHEDQATVLSIASIADCEAETLAGDDNVQGTIVACYRGNSLLGYNYNWGIVDNDGRSWLTIGPFHSFVISGLTDIKQFNLCGYVGAAGGLNYPNDCGTTSDPFLQRNGNAVYRNNCDLISGGLYTVTATNKAGFKTPAASSRVMWVDAPGSGDPRSGSTGHPAVNKEPVLDATAPAPIDRPSLEVAHQNQSPCINQR